MDMGLLLPVWLFQTILLRIFWNKIRMRTIR